MFTCSAGIIYQTSPSFLPLGVSIRLPRVHSRNDHFLTPNFNCESFLLTLKPISTQYHTSKQQKLKLIVTNFTKSSQTSPSTLKTFQNNHPPKSTNTKIPLQRSPQTAHCTKKPHRSIKIKQHASARSPNPSSNKSHRRSE